MITSVGCFLVDSRDLILIGHPAYSGDGVGFWSIPKGKVGRNETIEDTLLREFKEETNIALSKYSGTQSRIFLLQNEVYKHKKKKLVPYVLFYDGIVKEKPKCISYVPDRFYPNGDPLPEFDKFLWASFDEAVEKLHYTQSNCLKKYKRFFKNRGKGYERLR